MDSSTSQCLPPLMLSRRVDWDVFLTFPGESDSISSALYNALHSNGFRIFLDNQGTESDDVMKEAIIDSALAVAIISPKYGGSRRCLDELSTVFEYRKRVVPVFYQVDPSNVRRQKGVFGQGFTSLVESGIASKEKVVKWRNALMDVGNVSGYPCRSKSDEPEVIALIVKQVVKELKNSPEYVAKNTVGLDSRVENVLEKLDIHSGGVQFLGIHGTPGIGKTTLAKAAFNKLTVRFKRRCFISNVREQLAKEGGVLNVLNNLLTDLSIGSVTPAEEKSRAKKSIEDIFNENHVLVVLDDVSEASQLVSLGIVPECFVEGSRIVVTSRDVGLLRQIPSKNVVLHEADKLNSSESLELFSIYALGRREPTEAYMGISKEIVSLTDGLPLALEVFGSSLIKKTMREWEDSLLKLRAIRPEKLQGVLKISYEALDPQEKTVFLDISCLFLQMNMTKEDVVDILEGCGLPGESAIIGNLVTKSLLKVLEGNHLWMHDQIKDMGKQIVIEESFDDPGKRSRLWNSGDIRDVLRYDRATEAILGVVLDLTKPSNDVPMEMINWLRFRKHPSVTTAFNYLAVIFKNLTTRKADENDNSTIYTKSFTKMAKLKLLQINYSKLQGNIKYMPSELRCLQWRGCSQKALSANVPEQLRVLDLSESKIRRLWSWGWLYWRPNKVARNLVVLNLSHSIHLTYLPDMSSHKYLKKLTLEHCIGLTKIHHSIGKMSSLVHLNLRRCSNLVDFPSNITGMKGLRELILSQCSKFQGLPRDVRSLASLTLLLLDSTAITELPQNLLHLTQLEVLDLSNCFRLTQLPEGIGKLSSLKNLSLNQTNLKALPESIGSLSSLEKLSLASCSSLATFPDSVRNLRSLVDLHLSGSSIENLPPSICSLSYLRVLSVRMCRSLSLLPVSIEGLASVTELILDYTPITHLPDEIGSLKYMQTLQMNFCKSLAMLPESIGELSNLTRLWLVGVAIKQLPESIGKLEKLRWLNLNQCRELKQLPDTIGMLRSLNKLKIEKTDVTFLPESFGSLESLRVLQMNKDKPMTRSGPDNNLHGHISVLPASFCNLSHLEEFNARACRISGQIHQNFDKLSKLEILNLGYNSFHSLPSSLEGLRFLKKLLLSHCEKLTSIPRVSSTLEELLCADCYALESVCDLSDLSSLQELQFANCYKLVDVPGLECLKSLRRLYMGGCTAGASAVKRSLSMVTLKNLTNLSVTGSEIPGWFSQEAINFATRPNLAIKYVLVAVVISVDFQKLGDVYANLPNIVGIEARILRQDIYIFSTTLNLAGIPMTTDDQLHLCRFKYYNPLVSLLREGDIIELRQRSDRGDGVELKKWGIFLVFENDDDYVGDEDSLPVMQLTVTQRLAQFFRPNVEN